MIEPASMEAAAAGLARVDRPRATMKAILSGPPIATVLENMSPGRPIYLLRRDTMRVASASLLRRDQERVEGGTRRRFMRVGDDAGAQRVRVDGSGRLVALFMLLWSTTCCAEYSSHTLPRKCFGVTNPRHISLNTYISDRFRVVVNCSDGPPGFFFFTAVCPQTGVLIAASQPLLHAYQCVVVHGQHSRQHSIGDCRRVV